MIKQLIGGIGFGNIGPWLVGGFLAILAAGAFTAIKVMDNSDKSKIDVARDAGGAEATVKGQETTIGQIGDANDAQNELESGGDRSLVRFNECLRNSRTGPAPCERFRPLDE